MVHNWKNFEANSNIELLKMYNITINTLLFPFNLELYCETFCRKVHLFDYFTNNHLCGIFLHSSNNTK